MEKNKNKKSTALLLSILGVLSLVLITAGVTYAFFSYTKEGQTENVIRTGSITFAYDETQANGAGIRIEDAMPMLDSEGKNQSGAGKVFNFTVTSTTPSSATISYIVTARKSASSTLASEQVKLWLDVTEGTNESNKTIDGTTVKTYSQLEAVGLSSSNTIAQKISTPVGTEERIIYEGVVPSSSRNPSYTRDFALKMWLNGENSQNNTTIADYSPYEYVLKTAVGATPTTVVAASCTETVSGELTQESCTAAGGTYTPAIVADVATDTASKSAESLIANNQLITSETYYNGTTDKSLYERIAFVSQDKGADGSRTVLTRSQALALNKATVDALGNYEFTAIDGYQTTEQYYQINGQSFTVTVNVYADGATVGNTGGSGN